MGGNSKMGWVGEARKLVGKRSRLGKPVFEIALALLLLIVFLGSIFFSLLATLVKKIDVERNDSKTNTSSAVQKLNNEESTTPLGPTILTTNCFCSTCKP